METARWRPRARRDERITAENSAELVSRCPRGSIGPDCYQADSSVRPLERRAARMARPARVRMRSRKPWVLARRLLFG
jgi:hypothetical protein